MIKNILLALTSSFILLTACTPENIYQVPDINTSVALAEHEPNFVQTLSVDGKQAPNINNIYRFGKVNDNLYRGGLPTDIDLQALKNFRIKTIISFRGLGDPTESTQVAQEKQATEKLGMKFLNIQIPFDKPIPEETIKSFFSAVTDTKNQPLYVHCKGGRDRTGTMVALYRIQFDKYTPQKAIEEMKIYTFNPTDYPIFTNQIMNFKPLNLKNKILLPVR